jgi:hypothetical protein
MSLADGIKTMLLETAKKAYEEGRKHQVEEESESVVGVLHMKSFEETETYKRIMETW